MLSVAHILKHINGYIYTYIFTYFLKHIAVGYLLILKWLNGKSHLQGKINTHTVRSLFSEEIVWIFVTRDISISDAMCFLSCVAIAT